MADEVVLSVKPLGFPWEAQDPFLFCAYHDDAYPEGNDAMGPARSLAGRDLGQDFTVQGRLSHVPRRDGAGIPAHPHRGFETVTIVREGVIDHSDSLGATARFGQGDVQWLTAGARHRALGDVPAAPPRRAEPARAVPDLAQPAGAEQDGRAALPHAVDRGRPAQDA